jgi:hypothetical protein
MVLSLLDFYRNIILSTSILAIIRSFCHCASDEPATNKAAAVSSANRFLFSE